MILEVNVRNPELAHNVVALGSECLKCGFFEAGDLGKTRNVAGLEVGVGVVSLKQRWGCVGYWELARDQVGVASDGEARDKP